MQLLHTPLGVFYAAVSLGEVYKTGYLVLVYRAVLHLPRQLEHAVVTRRVKSVDYGQGEFALGHVVAGGLAYLGRVVIVEYVVANLEDNAQRLAEALGLAHPLFGHAGRYGAYRAARLEQRGGLATDDFVVCLFGNFALSDTRKLEYLTVGKRAAELGQIPDYQFVVRYRHVQQRRREDIVAHEHRHLVVIQGVDRRLPAALAALVHHVVMHERGRMQQLQTHRGVQRGVVHGAVVPGHQHYQHRPHALARAVADTCEDFLLKLVLMG